MSGRIVYTFALLFGASYGGYVPQFPLLTMESFGTKSYGLLYGMISSGFGFGALLGPPVLGGLLYGATGNYFATFVLSGAFSLVAAVIALSIELHD